MSSLSALTVDRSTFPVVECVSCGQRALAWLDFDEAGAELLRCLGCGAPTPADTPLARAGERAVEALGYVFIDKAKATASSTKLSGCGAAGIKSCGTSCSTGGGCSSGSCGSGGCGS